MTPVRCRPGRLAALGCGVALLVAGCGDKAAAGPEGVRGGGSFVRVVGTVQDGGLPHAACSCVRCERARRDPRFARRIAGVAVVVPERDELFLIDASPDLRTQLDALRDVRDPPQGRVDRHPVDGVLLTHAHMGHYLGLAFLGYEAVHATRLPVWCTPRMAAYLRDNGPWSQLVGQRNVDLREVEPDRAFALAPGLRATAVPVPHRDEYSDTVGWRIEGPRATLLYVPDTDAWERWDPPLEERLIGVDYALLDGTFYSMDELPGRDISQIPHPLITATMDGLEERVRRDGLRVFFTHLNHSNPALEPDSAAARAIEARGSRVLAEGEELPL